MEASDKAKQLVADLEQASRARGAAGAVGSYADFDLACVLQNEVRTRILAFIATLEAKQ